jgi:hypothetical protein
MSDPTYTETVTQLRGDMREGFAEIKGQLSGLTQAVEASNRARIAEAEELRKDVDDHEERIRQQDRDINRVATRVAHVEATSVTPRKLWGVAAGLLGLMIAAAGVAVNALG